MKVNEDNPSLGLRLRLSEPPTKRRSEGVE